jgi:hypothetical protein
MKADMVGKTLLVPEIQDAELLGDLARGTVRRGDYERLDEAAEDLCASRPSTGRTGKTTPVHRDLRAVPARVLRFQNA